MTRRFRWTLVAATVLLLVSSAQAQASKPERYVFEFADTVPFGGIECDGVPILVDFVDRHIVQVWRDAEGRITLVKDHAKGEGTIYPEGDRSNSDTGRGSQTITIDFVNETFTRTGNGLHNNVPGLGRVAHESGTVTERINVLDDTGEFDYDTLFDRFEFLDEEPVHIAGPHPDFFEIDWCSIFST
jgi:hypothetical protein